MPENPENRDVELKKELSRYTSLLSKVSFTGDFVILFFRKLPKANIKTIREAVSDHLGDKFDAEFSFFKVQGDRWVFRRVV